VIKLKLNLPPFFRKGIFAKKWVRYLLDIFGALFGLALIILILLLGRLSMGPINLDFLTPDIEAAFKAPHAGISATIEHTQLAWKAWSRPFEIELVNVHIQKDKNPDWLKIEHIGVSVRLYRLVFGDVSLKQLRLYHPQILLEKDREGKFILGFGEAAPSQAFSLESIAPLLALGEPNPALGKLNELHKISIIDAHVHLKDLKEIQEWLLPKTSFVLTRDMGGFHTEVKLKPQQGSGSLTLGLAHRLGTPRFDLTADFHRIIFKSLIEKAKFTLCSPTPEGINPDDILNFLQGLNMPLHGKVHLALIPTTLQVIEGTGDIDVGEGELDLSLARLLPLPITSGSFSFVLSPNSIELKKASLLSDEMVLDFSGNLAASSSPLLLTKFMGPGQTLTLQGQVEHLFLDHLSALWPQDFAPEAREWLTKNLRIGTLTQATFSLKGNGGEEGLIIDDLQGTLKGKGADVTYLEGLPPAQNVTAEATFDQKGFDIKILSGEVDHLKVQEGRVVISGLDTGKEALRADIKAKGPVADILDVLNHKPLEYATKAGIDPKKTKGEGTAALHIDFPLLADLRFKDVKMSAKGEFKKVTLERKITEDLKALLTGGNFSLDLTQDQMVIKGKGVLNQFPSLLTYTHYFQDAAPQMLQIQVETTASFEDFNRLGFDCREYAKGPTKTNLTYTLRQDEKGHLLVNLDTTFATLSFLPLEWVKRPGEKSTFSFDLVFKEGQLSKMKDLKMSSSTYSLEGSVLFGPQKSWQAILLSEFKGPHTDTQVTLHKFRENAYEVSFKGKSVDLEKSLAYINQEENAQNHPSTEFKLMADVNQLRLGEGKIFQNVKASADLLLQGSQTTWKAVSLRAKAGEGTAYKGDMAKVSGGVLFEIKPGLNNAQTLEVRANDAGQFLKNLSIYDEIRGGYITIKADRQGQGPYKGVFKMKQFNANKVPLLARFAALLSPMGIVNLLSESNTLSMDRFECNFEFSEDSISVKNGIGKSISLGFTTEGKLNRRNRLYSLKGNIIPARFLNSILSNIPIIGSLLNGGEGEGLFGIAYTVKGSFDAPEVSLNPLSALAPGFIRKLFQSLGDDE